MNLTTAPHTETPNIFMRFISYIGRHYGLVPIYLVLFIIFCIYCCFDLSQHPASTEVLTNLKIFFSRSDNIEIKCMVFFSVVFVIWISLVTTRRHMKWFNTLCDLAIKKHYAEEQFNAMYMDLMTLKRCVNNVKDPLEAQQLYKYITECHNIAEFSQSFKENIKAVFMEGAQFPDPPNDETINSNSPTSDVNNTEPEGEKVQGDSEVECEPVVYIEEVIESEELLESESEFELKLTQQSKSKLKFKPKNLKTKTSKVKDTTTTQSPTKLHTPRPLAADFDTESLRSDLGDITSDVQS